MGCLSGFIFIFNFKYLKIGHVQEELGCGTWDNEGKFQEDLLLIHIRTFRWGISENKMDVLESSESPAPRDLEQRLRCHLADSSMTLTQGI